MDQYISLGYHPRDDNQKLYFDKLGETLHELDMGRPDFFPKNHKLVMPPRRTKKVKKDFDVKELISTFHPESIICWTDGACKGNPGPGGSGCYIELPESLKLLLAKLMPTSTLLEKCSKNYKFNGLKSKSGLCELLGVEMAFDILDKIDRALAVTTAGDLKGARAEERKKITNDVHILTDSTYSVGMFEKGWNAAENIAEVKRIKEKILERKKTSGVVKIDWVKAHCGIPGNELADELANRAIEEKNGTTFFSFAPSISSPPLSSPPKTSSSTSTLPPSTTSSSISTTSSTKK